MEQTTQFYRVNNGESMGVLLDGGCGFRVRSAHIKGDDDNIREYPMLTICPLKYRQEPGEINEDNSIVEDAGFIGITFGSEKSVDVMIEALNEIKEKCFNNN